MAIATVNPTTGKTVTTFETLDAIAIQDRLAQAQAAFADYRQTSFAQRTHCLHAAADILEVNRQAYGEIMTREMGKPLASAIAEVTKCAWVCRFYAEQGDRLLADVPTPTDGSQSFVRYQPSGLCWR